MPDEAAKVECESWVEESLTASPVMEQHGQKIWKVRKRGAALWAREGGECEIKLYGFLGSRGGVCLGELLVKLAWWGEGEQRGSCKCVCWNGLQGKRTATTGHHPCRLHGSLVWWRQFI